MDSVQLTNLNDRRRLGIFESLTYTDNVLRGYPDYRRIAGEWLDFLGDITSWARDRSGNTEEFDVYCEEFKNQMVRKFANSDGSA